MRLDFQRLHQEALPMLPAIAKRLLPNGKVERGEYVALNPRRLDKHKGSFKINLKKGCWADFAVGVSGGDVISLVAYIENITQYEAAHTVAKMIGRPL